MTLEDLAEELVGEIQDEDDLDVGAVELRPDGSWAVPGRLRIDEIADATGIALPEDDEYDTVSGLVLRRLGRTARGERRGRGHRVAAGPRAIEPVQQVVVIRVDSVAGTCPAPCC